MSFLIVCGVGCQLLSSPVGAEQIDPRDSVASQQNGVTERRSHIGWAISSALGQIVHVPSSSNDTLTESTRVVLRSFETVQLAVVESLTESAALTVRRHQLGEDNRRTDSGYPAWMVPVSPATSPQGPVIFAESGERSRDRVSVPDGQ